MVSNPPNVMRASGVLLVVSESQNTAKRIESHMRNAGHPLRAAWVADVEELNDVLTRAAPDLVLCTEHLPRAPHRQVVELCARVAPDLPVILMSDRLAPEDTVAALASGARDLVSPQELRHLKHLELVLMREYTSHHHLRELRRARMQLADFEARHRSLLAGTADAVAHVQEGILVSANPSFSQMLGYGDADELSGMPLMDLICADHQPALKEHFKKLVKGTVEEGVFDVCFQHRDGHRVGTQAHLARTERDGELAIELLIRAEALSPARGSGGGEANGRAALLENLRAANADGKTAKRSLLYIVVDEYARLEERLGFFDAEQVTATLMELIQSRLKQPDLLFRFSTSEFVALIASTAPDDMEILADALRKDVAAQVFKTPSYEAHITLSIGAYPSRGGEERPLGTLNDVGQEVRRLSTQGGNRIALLGATAKAAQAEKEGQQQAARVRKAIEDNRLKLAYQNIASLEGDPRSLFDVFVRMIDETGRELLAREFLPAAEKYGLMGTIDRWVITRCLKLISKHSAARESATLFLRLSEESLKDSEGFLKWLQEQLAARPLAADELIIEIQESILQNHIRKAKVLSRALTEMKIGVAIDYFGISPHAAALLEHIPARYIKFHHHYTQKFEDPATHKRMSELLEVSKQKQIKAIVSHVEDANVMARLWQMGVNYIQGNSVQEPEVVLMAADVKL